MRHSKFQFAIGLFVPLFCSMCFGLGGLELYSLFFGHRQSVALLCS